MLVYCIIVILEKSNSMVNFKHYNDRNSLNYRQKSQGYSDVGDFMMVTLYNVGERIILLKTF